MTSKSLLALVLIGFVAISLGYLALHEETPPAENAATAKEAAGKAPAPLGDPLSAVNLAKGRDTLIVYYAHGHKRCPSCLAMERMATEIVHNVFAKDVAAGRLLFASFNYQEDGHAQLAKEFELSFSTVILADVRQNRLVRFKNCEKVWDYVLEPKRYEAYLTDEIRGYLRAN